jgi:hypothetical protein
VIYIWVTESGDQEWNENVVNVALTELEVVTLDADKLDFPRFVELSQADIVIYVEVRIFKGLDSPHVVVELLEPFRLFRENHRVLRKKHQHSTIQLRESILVEGHRFFSASLVIEIRQELTKFKVFVHVARVSEVACRAYHILNYVVVSKVSRYEVD